MRPIRVLLIALLATAAALAVAPTSSFALASRTWVSGVGNDADPCSRTAPCKTFAGAISKTVAGGEIDAMDPGGYGALTITKAITIDGGGTLAAILDTGTTGIVVNAPGAAVVLRNLSINGAPPDPPPTGSCQAVGLTGVRVLAARSVQIDDSVILQHSQNGVLVNPSTGTTDVSLNGVAVENACGSGATAVNYAPVAPGTATGVIRNSSISTSVTGIHAGSGAHVWITGTSVFGNGTGLRQDGDGLIDAIDQNQIVNNGTNGAPHSTISSAPPVTVPGPTVTKTVTVPAPPRCIVPTLTGLSVKSATAKLKKQDCAIGKVSSKTTKTKKLVGKVLSQKTEAGTTHAKGTKVNVTVGKKAKKKRRR
jgi:hypothetical protein